MQPTENLNVREMQLLIPPRTLKTDLPMTEAVNRTVVTVREEVKQIITGRDKRLLAIVGPCSIHDPAAALEYARRLAALKPELADRFCLVMRVYFEKPRTTLGWRGLINDPHLDGSGDVESGLRQARRLLLDINELGLGTATEMLEPIVPQYLCDLVSWAAIGARTTESQTHREMASGLSMPVGFKNNTEGNLKIAVDAMVSTRQPHSFLGIDENGATVIVHTRGNPWVHIVLRGGRLGPNYDPRSIQAAKRQLQAGGQSPLLMVDCSHANSGKRHENQELVLASIMQQRAEGEEGIIGFMVESNLLPGAQPISVDRSKLAYGVSITDPCVGWDDTARMLRAARETLSAGIVR